MEINGNPIRILLVEDNPVDARLLRDSLTEVDSSRFDLTHVSTLSAGVECLAESVIDVVLLDLSLPDSFGLDSFIQAHAQAPGVPFVVLTGLADETLAIAAVREGAQDYLVKGEVAPELLVRSIHYAIERKRTEETLRESEERLRNIFDHSSDAIFIIDPEQDRILDVNTTACSMLGYSHTELLSTPMFAIYPNERLALHTFAKEACKHQHGWTEEFNFTTKAGETIPTEISASVVDIEGRECLIATVRDITDRKQVEVALRQHAEDLARSNAELQQFAYIASHDLQEPLRMVSSYTQLLGRRYKGKLDAEADEFIEYAVDGAQRMQNLINDLLAYSRVGTDSIALEPIDFNVPFNRAVSNLQATIRDSQALVTHDPLPTVRADASQLTQVLQNLIGNAIKFHGEDPPRIHVSTQLEDHRWVFSVTDNGLGIEPQYADRIFAIFQRLHTRDQYSGTGIGLAICKKVVERHGGRIWIESEPGEGTTFYFTIPMAEDNQP